MDRRSFLKNMSIAFGASLVAPLDRFIAAHAEIDPIRLTGSPELFTGDVLATVESLTETIIPTTDTPGAIAAGVPMYIDFMLTEWYSEEERKRFVLGVIQVSAYSLVEYSEKFHRLTTEQQKQIVESLQAGELPVMKMGGKAFFDHVKQLTLAGYYTSEIGMTVERVYLPVPGRYDGAYPFEDVGTLFSS